MFRIDAGGENYYLLRIEGTPSPLRHPYQDVSLGLPPKRASRRGFIAPTRHRTSQGQALAAKYVLGKMFVASFLTDVATPGFDLGATSCNSRASR
ncbi:hypothetical protein [Bradyrhizobium sp. NAS96.2]|uniref:hypothetical protein n=1 Tax=Bradyrhizobium sp. NAS96.2 TaxID=1680160 RepID=UPI00093CDE4F|nr:hypothetical protein [Bradyrhizobium sp. NAS96.2]OKO83416.1 hypothetical protein AC628_02050 [Bradyrhizobium sp. NAS96.2]